MALIISGSSIIDSAANATLNGLTVAGKTINRYISDATRTTLGTLQSTTSSVVRDYAVGVYSSLYDISSVYDPDTVSSFKDNYYRKDGVDVAFDDMWVHTATSMATMTDYDGFVKWRPHNLFDRSNTTFSSKDADLTATENYESTDGGSAVRYAYSSGSGGGSNGAGAITLEPGASYNLVLWIKDVGGSSAVGYGIFDEANGAYFSGHGFATSYPSGINSSTYTKQTISFTAASNSTTARVWVLQYSDVTTVDVAIAGVHIYRTDTLDMVNDPTTNSTLVINDATTANTSKYGPRIGHHSYNGSEMYNMGLYLEQEAGGNDLTDSNGFAWSQAGTPVKTQDLTGPDGQANSAWTMTDDDASGLEYIYRSVTCPNDSNPACGSVFIKYDATFDSATQGYPVMSLYFLGGTTQIVDTRIAFDPKTGAYVTTGTLTCDPFIERVNADWWRVAISVNNNSTGNTACRIYLNPSAASSIDPSYVQDGTKTGSVGFYGAQIELAKDSPGCYIPTTTVAKVRAAESVNSYGGTDDPKRLSNPDPNTGGLSVFIKGTLTRANKTTVGICGWRTAAANYQDDFGLFMYASGENSYSRMRLADDLESAFGFTVADSATTKRKTSEWHEKVSMGWRINVNGEIEFVENGASNGTTTSLGNFPVFTNRNRFRLLSTWTTTNRLSGTIQEVLFFYEDIGSEAAKQVTGVTTTGGLEKIITDPTDGLTYKLHTFYFDGTLDVKTAGEVEYLIVGGGGGGGNGLSGGGAGNGSGGGGGGGEVATGTISLSPGSYTIDVGIGGAGAGYGTVPGATGANTTAFGIIAQGGGGGGSGDPSAQNGSNGASGGGGGADPLTAGTGGAATVHNNGADGVVNTVGGGGGGAGGAPSGSTGGVGVTSTFDGTSIEYGAGGDSYWLGAGSSGANGTGTGGDSGYNQGVRKGGTGVVMIRYKI